MAEDQRRPIIPSDVVELYALAKEAFIYHEQQERKWDVPSLLGFRDALNDLIQASDAKDEREADGYVATASEHLSIIIAEALQRATEERLLLIDKLAPPRMWRRLLRRPYIRNTPSRIYEETNRIGYYLSQGRDNKASIIPTEAKHAFESFRSAYDIAVTLERDLRLEQDSMPWKLPVTVLAWVGSMIIAGLIGFAINVLLTD